MCASTKDAWLVSEGKRLTVIPDAGEAWANGHESAVFRHAGSEYRFPQYASEWLALTRSADKHTVVGIFFDMVTFADLTRWLCGGFDNVRRVGGDAFQIILTEQNDYQEDGWPFLPCEALRSDANDYAIWIPSFY